MDTNFRPVIKRGPRGKYRQHSVEFKRTLVEMAMQPGVSVARLAREHGVNANQVFSWRKLYEGGQLVGGTAVPGNELMPVVVTTPAQPSEAEPAPAGIITLEIGRVRLRIEGQANGGTLAQVLEHVLR
ncbi:transposase [Duganella sp. CF458]|uniref:IS66-like element accessory protein TnpA n=1 Tax=Duganella sp. CF458 TaxID=1884368 RepID=UPI0008DFFE28|nr:transposase [Duganella sp. CF458]SFH05137.1 transposase [Duganella sp. CF458]